MKTKLLILLALLAGYPALLSAQIWLKIENNTSQYFTATLLDINWNGSTPQTTYIDVPDHAAPLTPAIVQTGQPLANVNDWFGIHFKTHPGWLDAVPVFNQPPFTDFLFAPGGTYTVTCSITSPTEIYVRIDP